MKKCLCSLPMILCLVLTACGGTKGQQLESDRNRFAQAEQITLTAQVQADFGETVEEYTVEYRFAQETWTALVTQPEFVAGITARITQDASELEYQGAILPTGDLTGNGIVPISAVPMIQETLRTGLLDSVWTEGELLAGTFVYDDAISVTVWFDARGLPAAGQLAENGIVKAECFFSNVEIEESSHGTTEETDLGGNQLEEPGT